MIETRECPHDGSVCDLEGCQGENTGCPISGVTDGFTGWICCSCGDLQDEYQDRDPKDPRCKECNKGER